MALGTNHVALTEAATFIPEMWSDEVIAAYKSNLVVANHVTKINHMGKKGDTIHIPKPTRGSASAKSAETQVTLIANTESEVSISIDQHYEYSRLIEDIVAVQALNSLRRFYTDDAGYALAKQVDTALMNQLESLNGGTAGAGAWAGAVAGDDGSTAYDPSANTNAGNGAALADAGIREMINTLDDADVPFDNRVWIVPPIVKKTLLGIDRFTIQSQVGEVGMANSIRNGLVGDLYGSPVYVSTNCPTEVADDTTTNYRIGALLHKDALVFVEQLGVRSQTQYKQEWLGDLFTADTIYGKGELRDDAGITFAVPA